MVADFDFRGLANILGTHIRFLEADCEAKGFTCAGKFVDKPLLCCLRVCCEGSIVSEEHVTYKYSFYFGLGADPIHLKEFTFGACIAVHTVSEGVKGMGLEERGKDSKECLRVLELRHTPISHRF